MVTTAEPTTAPVPPRPDVLYKESAVAGYDDVTYQVK